MILIRQQRLYFVLVLAFMVLHGESCLAFPAGPTAVFAIGPAQEEADSDDDDEEEFEDEDNFTNNPWRIDERKLFAAKRFQLTKKFAVKIVQIDHVCSLDKKQKLKLKIASKGATEKALVKFEKQWQEQLQRFGNFNQQDDDDDKDAKKKTKRKKKKKRFVVNKLEEIDLQVFQMLDQNFTGAIKPNAVDVKIWTQTVEKVLSDEQREKLEAHVNELKLAKRNARADSFITNMRSELALADSQLDEFDKLIRPGFIKKDFDVNWNYEAMLTLYLGSKHNKSKMKKLLSEEQHMVLRMMLKPAENYGGMFEQNNNAPVARAVAGPGDFFFEFLESLFNALGDFADNVEDLLDGVFEWPR